MIPAVEGKVIGYRTWKLGPGRLRSLNPAGGGWLLGVNHAQCKRDDYYAAMVTHRHHAGTPAWNTEAHAAPMQDCECGLYALHSLAQVPYYSPFDNLCVIGAVAAWGKIEVHNEGFRAEFAEPVALAPSSEYTHDKVSPIAEEWEIPYVRDYRALPRIARKFGQPVDASLIPPVFLERTSNPGLVQRFYNRMSSTASNTASNVAYLPGSFSPICPQMPYNKPIEGGK